LRQVRVLEVEGFFEIAIGLVEWWTAYPHRHFSQPRDSTCNGQHPFTLDTSEHRYHRKDSTHFERS
jgi:hypothetical protein